jgi:hypothetical protein
MLGDHIPPPIEHDFYGHPDKIGQDLFVDSDSAVATSMDGVTGVVIDGASR